MAYPPKLKEEALRLRTEQNLGLKDISNLLGVSKGTLSLWLRAHPIPSDVLAERSSQNGKSSAGRFKPNPSSLKEGDEVWFKNIVDARKYTSIQMGAISETAVLFRLYLNQFEVFRSASEGSRVDWIVLDPETGITSKVQVKTANVPGSGLPTVNLRCAVSSKNGLQKSVKYRKYRESEFDFIIGYCMATNTCFVWFYEEIKRVSSAITVSIDAMERWDKLRGPKPTT